MTKLNSYFHISERKSTLTKEVMAGVSVYLGLAYIFIVNPAILSNAGMDTSAVLFATVIASGLSTLLMGLWARVPFALAPGLEMNGFVAFVVVGTLGLTWQEALGAVFWSGVLCVILTLLPARRKIISAIPDGLKTCMGISVGVFVATIGLFLSKIVIFNSSNIPTGIGDLGSNYAIALYIGLSIAIVCNLKLSRIDSEGKSTSRFPGGVLVPGGFLIAIIASAIYCRANGISEKDPASISVDMLGAIGEFDLFAIFKDYKLLPVFMVLFLIDFYGSIGKFIGLTASTNLSDEKEGMINIGKALYVDGIGTVGGAFLGTTSIITYVESAIGIHAGGRTGLVAVVCGILMLASILLTPLVGLVPVVATSGVLIYVGYLLLPIKNWKQHGFGVFDLIVAVAMSSISFATFSLD
ncbi:MAG: NCS2 family permease, partial [Desulfobacterales bacterium]|nr:NCS2 family permease [Desulfobacterales bacterium]